MVPVMITAAKATVQMMRRYLFLAASFSAADIVARGDCGCDGDGLRVGFPGAALLMAAAAVLAAARAADGGCGMLSVLCLKVGGCVVA